MFSPNGGNAIGTFFKILTLYLKGKEKRTYAGIKSEKGRWPMCDSERHTKIKEGKDYYAYYFTSLSSVPIKFIFLLLFVWTKLTTVVSCKNNNNTIIMCHLVVKT